MGHDGAVGELFVKGGWGESAGTSEVDACKTLAFTRLPEDDPRQRCPDISLAQNLLAWAPRVQLRDGLMKTIEYFERLLRSDPRDERLPIRLATTAR